MLKLLADERIAYRIALVVFIVVLALVAFGQVSYNDFWWHLALGKWMIATRSFLTHDIFSYTFPGKLWLNNTWLFDGLLYLLYASSSFWGINALRFLFIGLGYFFFMKASRVRGNAPRIFPLALFLLTLPLLRNFMRPELTQAAFVGFFLYSLYAFKYHRRKLLFLLPVAEVLWVNMHGSFLVGPLLIGIFLASEITRLLIQHRNHIQKIFSYQTVRIYAIVLLTTSAITLINPYGIGIYPLLDSILSDAESLFGVQEWQPTAWKNLVYFPLNGPGLFLPVSLWLVALVLGMKIRRLITRSKDIWEFLKSVPYEDIAIAILFLILMLDHTRYMYLWTLVAVLLIAKNGFSAKPRISKAAASALFAVSLGFALFHTQSSLALNRDDSEFSKPQETVQFMLEKKVQGPIINEYADGSYLTWALYPDYTIFIDGRTPNLYDNQFFWYYQRLGDERVRSTVFTRYKPNALILPITSPLTIQLRASSSPEWKLVSFDNYAELLVKDIPEHESIISSHLYTILDPVKDPKEYLSVCEDAEKKKQLEGELRQSIEELDAPLYSYRVLTKLALECDKTRAPLERAEMMMQESIRLQPKNYQHYYYLASVELELDRPLEAITNFKQSIKLGTNKLNMTGLAIAYHNAGDYRRAKKVFQKAFFLPGDTPLEYYQIYGRVLYQLDENIRATELFHRYLDSIDPRKITAQDYVDLSLAYRDAGDSSKAQEYLQKAQILDPTLSSTNYAPR